MCGGVHEKYEERRKVRDDKVPLRQERQDHEDVLLDCNFSSLSLFNGSFFGRKKLLRREGWDGQ